MNRLVLKPATQQSVPNRHFQKIFSCVIHVHHYSIFESALLAGSGINAPAYVLQDT